MSVNRKVTVPDGRSRTDAVMGDRPELRSNQRWSEPNSGDDPVPYG
jgi:hypothetical protein